MYKQQNLFKNPITYSQCNFRPVMKNLFMGRDHEMENTSAIKPCLPWSELLTQGRWLMAYLLQA